MIFFIILALIILVATGIPLVKKWIENQKLLWEYIDEQCLGKHEAMGKIKDAKTTNDKIIEALFCLSFIALIGGSFYNFYLNKNENSTGLKAQQQSEKTMASITTGQNQKDANQNQAPPVIQNNVINDANDAQVQENIRREQARLDKLFAENQKNTENLMQSLKKSSESKDTGDGIKDVEKVLENIKKTGDLFKNTKCVATGDENFDKECPKQLEKRKQEFSIQQLDMEKEVKQILDGLKNIEKTVKDIKDSETVKQATKEGGKLWDELVKKVDEFQKKNK